MSSNSSGSGSGGASKTPFYVYHERMIIVAYLGAIVIPIAVVMNLLMILAFIVYKKLRITGMYFIVNLAFSNLVATIISAPIIISSLISDTQEGQGWLTKGFPCEVRAFLDNMLLCASAVTLAVSSVDRCLAVSKPFNYHKLITNRRAVLLIGAIWATCFLISIPPLDMKGLGKPLRDLQWGYYGFSRYTYSCGISLNGGYPMFYFIFTLFIPVIVAIISYSVIFSVATKSNKSLVKLYQSVTPADFSRKNRTMKSAFRTLALVGVFAITYLPILVVSCVYWVLAANGLPLFHMDATVTKVLLWVVYSNYALNPLVYGLMDRNFRGAFKSFLRCNRYHDEFRQRAQKQLYHDLEEDRRRSLVAGTGSRHSTATKFQQLSRNGGSFCGTDSEKFLAQSIPLTAVQSNGPPLVAPPGQRVNGTHHLATNGGVSPPPL